MFLLYRYNNRPSHKICSKHFESDQFQRDLKSGSIRRNILIISAVPTKNTLIENLPKIWEPAPLFEVNIKMEEFCDTELNHIKVENVCDTELTHVKPILGI